METEILLPCPFCGGEAYTEVVAPHVHTIATFMPDYKGGAMAACGSCHAAQWRDGPDAEAEVIALWNRRAALATAQPEALGSVSGVMHDARAATPTMAQPEAKPGDRVPMPQNEDQAALMCLIGESWLRHNSPHRLRPEAKGEGVDYVAIANRAQALTGRSVWPSTVKAVLEATRQAQGGGEDGR